MNSNFIHYKLNTLKEKLKGAWHSATIWFNGLITTIATMLPVAVDQLPQLHTILPNNLYAWAFGAAVVGNILLRFRTRTALENK